MRIGTTAVTGVQSLESRVARYGPIVYSALLLTAAILSRFAILSNDSFPLGWQAEHLSISDPASFYNGFFPIGYALLLRVAGVFGDPYLLLEVLQIVLAIFYIKKLWAFTRSFIVFAAAIIAIPLVAFSPQVIFAACSAVPDFFAALFAVFAYVEIIKNERRSDVFAGLYLGLGVLFREHVLVLLIAVTIALILVQRRAGLRRSLTILGIAILFFGVQGIVQRWSGHGFFENDQAFNLWKSMHGIDWTNPPTDFHSGLFQIILSEPQLFLQTYVGLFVNALYLIIPLLLFLFVQNRTSKGLYPKNLEVLAIAALLYLLVTTAGGSARSDMLVLPIVVVCIFKLIQDVGGRRIFSRIHWAFTCSVALVLVAFTIMVFGALRAAKRVNEYDELQHTLGIQSVAQARTIFTDDFALSFPSLVNAIPRTSGGWGEIGLPEYLHANPHIPDTSANVVYSALKENGIQYIVIRNPPIDARLMEWTQADTAHFKPVPFSGSFYVYQVQ
jgi:hypothetical protein